MAVNRQLLKLYDDDGGNAVSPQLDGVTDPSVSQPTCFGFYSNNDYPGILMNMSFPVDTNGYGFRLSFGGAKDVTWYKYLTFKLQSKEHDTFRRFWTCLLYTSPSPRD